MLEDILSEIEKQTDVSKKELLEKVDKRYQELEGLITKDGAAYLVARDLGIDLPNTARKLQMKNIVAGMRNVNILGRIFRISSVNEFVRQDGGKGRVVNIFLSDGTTYVRIPLWDNQVSLIEEETIKLGDVIQITNGLARENVFGDVEISLGKFGTVKQIEDSMEFPSLEDLTKRFLVFSSEKSFIKGIMPGNFEIKADVVNVFKGNFLFNICPVCSNSLDGDKCSEHGTVDPNQALVVSCIVDDGTGDLRVVFFRELAEKLCGVPSQELSSLTADERYNIIKEKLLGRVIVISGKVKKNKLSDRLEMMANDFKDLNVLEESKKLVEEIELAIGE